ncbi:4a-hydroxytetrahydrobiopterin dehydratase [Streptomyces sp. JJ66]|uniref:4a-hydroxytetrahydrobiopterin dehydratase n=1 Tax=Streptomyces sp. JJ66 TaxID=2803843 RepID=UPI001C570858|nr:4a-hydroxytetrahydrobiopterin dehydratase [Streptomyces sp. JJ66]MBW1600542.1 4a-hydroxytetrahydrobiopterin dehydratase [Streptomyces sp. JJ66]
MAKPEPLSDADLTAALEGLPGWSTESGQLTRTYRLPSHRQAAAMVAHLAAIQDELNHHAELTLGYNTLAVSVTTHSAGSRITELDVQLAQRIQAVAPAHRATDT